MSSFGKRTAAMEVLKGQVGEVLKRRRRKKRRNER
jgi:hypothetical protein